MKEFGGGGDVFRRDLGDDVEVLLAAGKVGDIERREVGHLQWCSP